MTSARTTIGRDWRQRLGRWVSDPRLPLATLLAMAVVAFLVLMRYAAVTDFRELALERLQDDSYYYLQPAWDFAARRIFTFDGENPTYGFQPLWMLVLTFQAAFVPDKIAFLRAAVGLGALFYSLAGVSLYFLTRRWMGAWAALAAPAVWLFNANLAGVYITGKENALYAFLLVASTALVARRLAKPAAPRGAWVDGIVVGLLVLSRVNALVMAVLLAAAVLVASPGGWRERLQRTGWMGLGAGVILAAWAAYAWFAFGVLFPNSGTAKLYGSLAALTVFIDRHVSWLSIDQIAALLPHGEQIFLGNPAALVLPTRGLAESYFFGYLPEITLSALAKLWPFAAGISYRTRLLALALACATFLGWLLYSVLRTYRRRSNSKDTPRPTEAEAAAIAVGVLALAAIINGASNLMLLPAYLYWGTWYAVPEQVTLVVEAVTVLWIAAQSLLRVALAAWRFAATRLHHTKPILPEIAMLGGLVLFIGVVCLGRGFSRAWQPMAYTPAASSEAGYNGVRWMNEHLPHGSRVASYSSGLLGYFAEGYTIVNIDGLANTPLFAENETRGHLLFLRGLASHDPLVGYLQEAGITHLANAEPEGRIQNGPYLGLVEAQDGRLIYEGEEIIDWGPQEPSRRFIVVEVRAPGP